jgi:hypothetical protein
VTTHRHGWVLCSDGAWHANSTAFVITAVSTSVRVIALTFLFQYDRPPPGTPMPGSLVTFVAS